MTTMNRGLRQKTQVFTNPDEALLDQWKRTLARSMMRLTTLQEAYSGKPLNPGQSRALSDAMSEVGHARRMIADLEKRLAPPKAKPVHPEPAPVEPKPKPKKRSAYSLAVQARRFWQDAQDKAVAALTGLANAQLPVAEIQARKEALKDTIAMYRKHIADCDKLIWKNSPERKAGYHLEFKRRKADQQAYMRRFADAK